MKKIAALLAALVLVGPTQAQKPVVVPKKSVVVQKPAEKKPAEQPKADEKKDDKKVEEITDENIEVGKRGKLKGKLKLTGYLEANDTQAIGEWNGLTVIIDNYPVETVGKGKALSPDLTWEVTQIIKGDTTGRGLKGSYTLRCQNPPKK